jgi:TolA-binding protein
VPDTYLSYEIKPNDSIEERMTKLYLGIISVGEDLYCKGAAVAELNKQLNDLERKIAAMRKEFEEIKRSLSSR